MQNILTFIHQLRSIPNGKTLVYRRGKVFTRLTVDPLDFVMVDRSAEKPVVSFPPQWNKIELGDTILILPSHN